VTTRYGGGRDRALGQAPYYDGRVVTTKASEDDSWAIDDPVTDLRLRGGEQTFQLPTGDAALTLSIGAVEGSDIRLRDPSGCVSRHHADLVRERGAWVLHDRGSTNGIRQDGERRLSVHLTPGVEIDIGEIRLVAESPRLKTLRAFLSRIIGWDRSRVEAVDQAMQAVRAMATRRAALVLCGAGHLAGTARRLHNLALGEAPPFTMYIPSAPPAFDPASNGTYCFVDDALPDDFAVLAAAFASASSRSRLMVSSPSRADATEAMAQLTRSAVLELPSLQTRVHEIERLLLAYAADAAFLHAAPGTGFREHEMQWLRGIHFEALDEIEELTYRLVAMRNWNVTGGAQRLGISHVALSRWAKRRGIPT